MKASLSLVKGTTTTGPVFVNLPAKIGRGKGNVVFVQFGAQEISLDVTDQRVSRRHLEIVPVEDGIVLRDTSRNGTLVLVDGREERLPATAALATAPQRLRIGEMLIDLSPIGTEVRPVALQIVTPGGRESVVAIGQNGLVFGANGRKLSVVEAFDEHAVHLPDRVLFTICPCADTLILKVADRTSVPLHVNHARIASSRRPLDHLDLITVAGHTITVWDADGGGKGLRCPNTDCQLLNPYNPDEKCAFCGAKLDAGQTFIVE